MTRGQTYMIVGASLAGAKAAETRGSSRARSAVPMPAASAFATVAAPSPLAWSPRRAPDRPARQRSGGDGEPDDCQFAPAVDLLAVMHALPVATPFASVAYRSTRSRRS
jgi:hypothetical protein